MAEPAHGVARPEAEPRAVLVKAVNWLGDIVMSLPALRAVRAAHPEAHLIVLVRRELASFYDGATWIDEVLPYDRAPGLLRLGRAWLLAQAIRARGVELAVLFPTASSRRCGRRWRASRAGWATAATHARRSSRPR